MAQWVKNPSTMQVDTGVMCSIPGWGRSPGGSHGNPLQYFAWKIPWAEEPAGLQSIGLQRVGHEQISMSTNVSKHNICEH